MSALWKRLAGFVPSYVKSPTRLYVLAVVACIAALVILEREAFSVHSLSVAAAVVLAIGCLIYTPPRLLLMFALLAVGGFIWHEANRATWSQYTALLIVLGCGWIWIIWLISSTGNLILRRLDALEEKLGEKLGEIEQRRIGL